MAATPQVHFSLRFPETHGWVKKGDGNGEGGLDERIS